MRVLVIEDNDRLAKLVADGLQRRGFSCDIATSLSDADSAIAALRMAWDMARSRGTA